MKYQTSKIENLIDKLIKEYGDDLLNIIEFHPEDISEDIFTVFKETIQENCKPKEINTIYDLSKLLNRNSCGDELENPYDINIEELCKKNKWIVLFPYSDDNLEVRGYIYDEIGAWDGGNFKIVKKGEFYEDINEDNTYHKATCNQIMQTDDEPHIFMKWDPCDKPYVWYISANYPNVAYFDIISEDDDENTTWARCCIIDCSSIL